MALSQKHRTAIFEGLVPLLGEEVAEAFVAEFPVAEHDDLHTKRFPRAEPTEPRDKTRTDTAELSE